MTGRSDRMQAMDKPIFYDATGGRNRWTLRAFFALLIAVVLAAAGFAMTVVDVPVPGPLSLGTDHAAPRPLDARIGHKAAVLGKQIQRWLPHAKPSAASVNQISVGFYVPWDDASRTSLAAHIGQLDWLVTGGMSVTGPAHTLVTAPDPGLDVILAATPHRPKILPMVQNAVNDQWDGKGIAAMLHDPAQRSAFLARLEPQLAARHADGVVFDFEELPASAQHDYLRFLANARARFAPHHWMVTLAAPVDDPNWDLKSYGRIADRVFLMDYDEHTLEDEAGPIASQGWFVAQLNHALAAIPPAKAIVAIGNYAYDWTGTGKGDDMSVEEAWLAAHDSEAPIQFDRASGNAHFAYEEDGTTHNVWMLDAASAWNELRVADIKGVSGVALWRLGSEDAGYWKGLAAFQSGKLPDLGALNSVSNVDVEGNGEILRIADTPTTGNRALVQGRNGLIVDEQYKQLPTPYVVRRTGYQPKLVALTFDDGPDPDWTPRVLDILRAKQAPATFFVIGENALAHPLLLNRIIDQGSEIGNHTFTHPNLAHASASETRIELNATQRLVEAYTGRSTRLFRAPYFGDAEPTTADELVPALTAQQAGYTNVGLHVDPNDWQRPGVEAIVNTALSGVEKASAENSGQIVLLHDGGGDRSQTIAALPRIIDGLRAKGYTFVPVSRLAGLSRDQVMPPVTGWQLFQVRADIGLFLLLAALGYALKWIFFAAITLGIARALILAGLALNSNRKRNRAVPPEIDPARFVSVLIPAYNEAAVIEASVRRVLASTDVGIEVIVLDDGSKDATSEIVRTAFGNDQRVRLLTLENGGKARALNEGLKLARGEIIIALDADTQFEETTIARLARWFADTGIGAVAGNAKVGNRINLVTRWQAVEYVTAQNLERRALAQFDAIMVVPGAVGAWRRAALDAVGGYPTDTLAEDQDLTIAIQRAGWRVAYDPDAVAWTEAPESFAALTKQRFRWAFGTLQCLWKHAAILRTRKPAGLALVGVPQAWVFQIGFALISPLIDLALVAAIVSTTVRVMQHGWAQTETDVLGMGLYWIAFTAIDIACGWVAYRLERRETRYPALLLVAQRFVYRQLMYWVVIRAVANALRGPWVGWGKLERSGRVDAGQQNDPHPVIAEAA
jgi:cellulose synthase/poly-beta-1,6-N-acetylglucosamine synthase-like glycosyltransferase/peptidoglycan/xylan/chitin deacetylase (PgdA/CDA1 family)/spore germination protein YaaH